MVFTYRDDSNLNRGKPYRECSGSMLNKHRHESFNRAHDGCVDHHDSFLFAFFIDTVKVKSIRHVHIELNGGYLPFSADGVLGHKVYLWAVKGSFAWSLDCFFTINFYYFT